MINSEELEPIAWRINKLVYIAKLPKGFVVRLEMYYLADDLSFSYTKYKRVYFLSKTEAYQYWLKFVEKYPDTYFNERGLYE